MSKSRQQIGISKKIGDTVYFLHENQIKKDVIHSIDIHIDNDKLKDSCICNFMYGHHNLISISIDRVFFNEVDLFKYISLDEKEKRDEEYLKSLTEEKDNYKPNSID